MPVVISNGATSPENATVIWNRAIDAPVVTSSITVTGYPAINVIDPATYSSWKPTSSNGYILFNFGAPTAIDGAGIAAHNLATSGVTQVRIRSSSDNVSWVDRGTYTPMTNEDITFIFPQVTAQYWRVQLTGPSANIGCVAMGKRLVFPSAPVDDYTPLRHARQYKKLFNTSLGGQLLGNRVMAAGASTTVDFGFVDTDFVENELPEFGDHYARGGTFFYAGCPRVFPKEMGYCWAIGEDSVIDVSYIEGGELSNMSFGVNSYVPA